MTFLLNNLSRLLKIKGLKYIFVLVEFKHTDADGKRSASMMAAFFVGSANLT